MPAFLLPLAMAGGTALADWLGGKYRSTGEVDQLNRMIGDTKGILSNLPTQAMGEKMGAKERIGIAGRSVKANMTDPNQMGNVDLNVAGKVEEANRGIGGEFASLNQNYRNQLMQLMGMKGVAEQKEKNRQGASFMNPLMTGAAFMLPQFMGNAPQLQGVEKTAAALYPKPEAMGAPTATTMPDMSELITDNPDMEDLYAQFGAQKKTKPQFMAYQQ